MNMEAVNVGTPVAAVAEAPKSILASEFQEFSNIEVTGNFRGYWRDVPVRDENGAIRREAVMETVLDEDGKPKLDENGKPVVKQVLDENGQPKMRDMIRRQFKMTRTVKLRGKDTMVRQAIWLDEADAKAHNLVDGVKYSLTISVGEELMPSRSNGQPGFIDEYSFADATIVSVNSK